jgi:signal transduction histidine kinase
MAATTRPALGFTHETLRRTHEHLVRQFHASVLSSAQLRREASSLQSVASWVLRSSPAGWAAVSNGRVTYTNRSFDAFDRGSVIGPGWKRLMSDGACVDQDDAPGRTLREVALEEADELFLDPALRRRQVRFVRGPTIVELVVERPLAAKERGAALVLVRDITELVQAETRVTLLQARMLETERAAVAAQLAVGVAHDLGNLVGALRARIVGLPNDPAYRLVTSAMETIIDAQAQLVNRLQSVAHPRQAVPVELDLYKDVIQPAVQMVESSLRSTGETHGKRITIEVAPSLLEEIRVVAPRDDLINMVINLFLNARDAMPNGGTIRVEAHRLFGGVQLRIEDEGVGIPPENLAKIFEPLFSTKGENGMGMGLATAANLMRRLGGTIVARNRARGGACFEVTFVDPSSR